MSQAISNSWSYQCNAISPFSLLEKRRKRVELAELSGTGNLLLASGKGLQEKKKKKAEQLNLQKVVRKATKFGYSKFPALLE